MGKIQSYGLHMVKSGMNVFKKSSCIEAYKLKAYK